MQTTSLSASPAPLSVPTLPASGSYAVVLATGPDDGGKRATLAFAAACTAQAMELDTIVFMLGDGAHWLRTGTPSRCTHPAFRRWRT